jgi:hypothetical protein
MDFMLESFKQTHRSQKWVEFATVGMVSIITWHKLDADNIPTVGGLTDMHTN